MKKQEFLNELKRYLRVLQDEEQEDILQEYEQHIEMKIESGQSEEDVIRDFGSIRELAGEILEAYHVKLNDQEAAETSDRKKERKTLQAKPFAPVISSVKTHAANGGKGLLKGLSRCCFFLGKPFRLLGQGLRRTKEKMQNKPEIHREKNVRKQAKKGVIFPMITGAVKSICRGIMNGICWACRMVWNCIVVCAAAFSAGMGLVFLYLFGVLIILWSQGYPLGGIVLGSLGAVLCFMSLAVFGSTFYWRKPCFSEHDGGRAETMVPAGKRQSKEAVRPAKEGQAAEESRPAEERQSAKTMQSAKERELTEECKRAEKLERT